MANTKISDLNGLSTVAAGDLFVLADISESETKRITRDNLSTDLAIPAADATHDHGTAALNWRSAYYSTSIVVDSAFYIGGGAAKGRIIYTDAATDLLSVTGATLRIQAQEAGAIVNTTVLGVLEFYGDDDTASADDVGGEIRVVSDATWTDGAESAYMALSTMNDGTLTEAIRIGSEQNVGIGNSSLESWHANFSVMQIGGNAAFYSTKAQGASGNFKILQNAYHDSVNDRWEYISTDEASRYDLTAGKHTFLTAASGTADNPITWITAQTITATGLTQFGTASGAGQVNITPGSAITPLDMSLGTNDTPFFNFQASADADSTSAISTLTTSGATTHHIQVDINGVKAWIAVSTNVPT